MTDVSSLRMGLRFHHFGETGSPLRWRVSKAFRPDELRFVEVRRSPLDGGSFATLQLSNLKQGLHLR